MFSIAFVQATASWMINIPDGNQEAREGLHYRFRTVPWGILSLFSLMSGGEDWKDVEQMLAEISVPTQLLFNGFLFFTLYGVLNIVTGLFVEQSSKCSRAQEELRVEEEKNERRKASNQVR